jgi:uncharacterized membrane protein YoaK (UPF0700 family)
MRRIYDLFVSGGKDSVVAATIAHEEAKHSLHSYIYLFFIILYCSLLFCIIKD